MRPMRGLVILTVVIIASVMLVAGCWAQATSTGRDLTSQICDAGPLAVLTGVEAVAQPDFAAIPGLDAGAAAVAANILAQSLIPFLVPQGRTNPLEDAYENMGKIATQKDVRDNIIKEFESKLAVSTNPLARTMSIPKAQLDGILQSLADEKTREAVIQKAVASIKSTINKDAAGKKLVQELVSAADAAIYVNFKKPVSADVKAALSDVSGVQAAKKYGDNFIALGYKVIDDILKDKRFQNLDKKFLENIVNIAVQNNALTKKGDLGAFRQGEDRAITVQQSILSEEDAAAKQQGQQLLTAADTAITNEYDQSISANVKTAVPEAESANKYADNFIALGYRVMSDVLKDERFTNLDKKIVGSIIDIAAQNNGIDNGDLASFRQGEDRAIKVAQAASSHAMQSLPQGPQSAESHSRPAGNNAISSPSLMTITMVLVLIALGILIIMIVR